MAQHRIAGLRFAGGIFTNLTHDHLDYHGTFDAYLKAKKGFFDSLPKDGFCAHQRRRQARPGDAAKHRRPPRHLLAAQQLATFRAACLTTRCTGCSWR